MCISEIYYHTLCLSGDMWSIIIDLVLRENDKKESYISIVVISNELDYYFKSYFASDWKKKNNNEGRSYEMFNPSPTSPFLFPDY